MSDAYESGATMVDAIALSSPSGHMSKRSRRAAQERLRIALFGIDGLPKPTCPQPSERERMLLSAKNFRELAARGMKPRAYLKEAMRLEKLANQAQGDAQ